MNKKIKVIELLNKIANNEKLPVKIMFNTVAWELMRDEKDYRSTHTQERLLNDDNWILRHLNVEVEILEDEEEIDIQELEDVNLFDNGQNFNDMPIIIKSYDDNFTNINNTINKLVQAVKRLDKKNK